MKTTKISSKGQVVLPKSLRESHKWESGTKLAVETKDDGILLRELNPFPETSVDQVFRLPEYNGKAKRVTDMNKAIDKEARRRRGRGRY